jgi:thiol:disulfide interchange protein DsbD
MASLRTSTGSPPRPRRRAEGTPTRGWRRAVAPAALALALAAPPAAAVELLPPHEAFVLSARALDASTLEARFNVVDGYYLYRDKLHFSVSSPVAMAMKPELPHGKLKHDEFFGDSETYRGLVVVRLPLAAAEGGRTVTLVTESQGCADAGICYPPQRQTLEVSVPAKGGPGPFAMATEGRPAWLK